MKAWRRSGKRAGARAAAPALELSFFPPDTLSGTPNEAFLAIPALTAEWSSSTNGLAFVAFDVTAWPFAGNVQTTALGPGNTVSWRIVLNTGPVVTSNTVVIT